MLKKLIINTLLIVCIGVTGKAQISGNVIRGEWKEISSGGEVYINSPRNHIYTFDITQNNANILIPIETDCEAEATLYTELGQWMGHTVGFNRIQIVVTNPGTYRLVVKTSQRFKTGVYKLTLNGPIRNIQKQLAALWSLENLSFGDEGGGGSPSFGGYYSPRNQCYTFEPELDSWFDITAFSKGTPIRSVLIDPVGVVEESISFTSTINQFVKKANQKGVYKLWVYTANINDRGVYKLEVVAAKKLPLTRVEPVQQIIKGVFSATEKQHIYSFSAREGSLEIMYRSPTTQANFGVKDQYGQDLPFSADNSPTGQLIDRGMIIKRPGPVTLIIQPNELNQGTYELLVWGNFDTIGEKKVVLVETKPVKSAKPALAKRRK